ncbi:MAG TPA: pyruvate kinase [Blastocatellia bacterium]|nr:pyruvate kinase [Blastocatellia bacterium]
MRRAKIVATIGPASESEEHLRSLMLAGMDVARINMSHGEREHHGVVIGRIRRVAAELNRPVSVMLDLSGPKIRTGKLREGQAHLEGGAELRITSDDIIGDAGRFSANYPLLAREVKPGDRILISDGEIELQVTGTTATDVIARVVHGGVLGEHKGINLPGAQISIPSITEKDVADLRFGIQHDIDIVAQSFVRAADDCRRAREMINEFGSHARLIAKIEKPEAVENFGEILKAADGVMVARGDLAVETSTERVPVLQKQIIREALLAEKRIITATQMLQSMIENPRPTRAEASDVSNAILDGSDAVMLSGETAVGRFPVESVMMMDRIIRSTEDIFAPSSTVMRQTIFGRRSGSYGRAISEAAVFAAEEAGCPLIVVITQSGHMARRIASLRPRQRSIALTSSEQTRRQLAIVWGVEPYPLDECSPAADDLLQCADKALVQQGLAERGQSVVVMAGRLKDITISLSMKLHRVGDFTPQANLDEG